MENGVNENVSIHRLYGAVEMDGKTYRVKVTLKEDFTNNEVKKAYRYEATKIELLAGQHEEAVTSSRNSNNSITAAKLLQNIEKSYGNGEKLLDFSKVVDENGEPKVVYHGTPLNFTDFNKKEAAVRRDGICGFFFATEQRRKSVAQWYAGDGGNVLPVFLNIKNPMVKTTEERYDATDIPADCDGIISLEAHESSMPFFDREVKRVETETLKKGDVVEITAFEPAQIESATDNVETFDKSNAIAESFMAETHPDYNKGKDGKRSAENGYNPDNLIHRCYDTISIDGQECRVKLTLKENPSQTSRKAYTYEVTK